MDCNILMLLKYAFSKFLSAIVLFLAVPKNKSIQLSFLLNQNNMTYVQTNLCLLFSELSTYATKSSTTRF